MGSVGRKLNIVKNSIEGIDGLELDAANQIEKYAGRRDEVGRISDAVAHLSIMLKNAVKDIERVIGEISEALPTQTALYFAYEVP